MNLPLRKCPGGSSVNVFSNCLCSCHELPLRMLYTLFCFVRRQMWSEPTSLPFFFSRLWTFCRSFRHRLFQCRLPASSVKDWIPSLHVSISQALIGSLLMQSRLFCFADWFFCSFLASLQSADWIFVTVYFRLVLYSLTIMSINLVIVLVSISDFFFSFRFVFVRKNIFVTKIMTKIFSQRN